MVFDGQMQHLIIGKDSLWDVTMVNEGRVCRTMVGGGRVCGTTFSRGSLEDNGWREAESVRDNVRRMSVGGLEGGADGNNSNRGGDWIQHRVQHLIKCSSLNFNKS